MLDRKSLDGNAVRNRIRIRFRYYLIVSLIFTCRNFVLAQSASEPFFWNFSNNTNVTDSSYNSTDSNGTVANATTEASFISIKEGDHYPTIMYPFGKVGRLVFPTIIAAYLFFFLTVVCDCFLVPCVQGISSKLDWSPDVAGATLMAAASSSPELFVNILATFLTNSDVGVGTVLGTGLFALLIVPALCILVTPGRVLRLDYWPIIRDTLAYLVSVIVLVSILADNQIDWYEAGILILIYSIYLIVLFFNDELRFKFENMMTTIHRNRTAGCLIEPIIPLLQKPGRLPISMSVEDVFYVLEDHTPEFYTMAQWLRQKSILAKIEWLLMWPIITILRMTVPTFWNSKIHQLYMITFLACVAWIGVICYCISWMITDLGNEISMPETVMGLTLIAAGMSIPETISGVIVAKQGYGTMALCNAIGSNTFAILMCLGLPWLIKIVFVRGMTDSPFITISSGGIQYSAFVVLFALLLVFSIFLLNKFRLKSKVSWLFIFFYIVFIGICIYIELYFSNK